ncbi:MAG: CBS domain-containing protein [Desulfocapsaceae bacterium]|nr:CBS domain-containing protein [Desulfocapsaceae bacterium]
MKTAADIMTAQVITVTAETTVQELAKLLSDNNISGAPVVDDAGNLLGVVTESDLIYQTKKLHIPTVVTILDSIFFLENPDRMEKEIKKMAGTRVLDIYSPSLTVVQQDTSLEDIATIMAEKNIHTLPVVRDKRLVGVIGKKDIIKTLIP